MRRLHCIDHQYFILITLLISFISYYYAISHFLILFFIFFITETVHIHLLHQMNYLRTVHFWLSAECCVLGAVVKVENPSSGSFVAINCALLTDWLASCVVLTGKQYSADW